MVDKLILEPTLGHMAVNKFLLILTAFAHFSYFGFLLGCTQLSVAFSLFDYLKPNHRFRHFSQYVMELPLRSKMGMFFFGVLPLLTTFVVFSQILYGMKTQKTSLAILTAIPIILATLPLLFMYCKSFAYRSQRYWTHHALGALALGGLLVGHLFLIAGFALANDPERWPFVTNIRILFMFSWNFIWKFVQFTTIAFAITGSVILYFYFVIDRKQDEVEPDVSKFVRNFCGSLTLAAAMGIPVVNFIDIVTLPAVGKSPLFHYTFIVGLFILTGVYLALFRMLTTPGQLPTAKIMAGVLAAFLVFTVADKMHRDKAIYDKTAAQMYKAKEDYTARQAEIAAIAERVGAGAHGTGGAEAGSANAPGTDSASATTAIEGMTGDAANGKALSTSKGCIACHSIDGAKGVGPTWKGAFDHDVAVADAAGAKSTIKADKAYLIESIIDPNAKIVDGYPSGVMPSQKGVSSDQEIADMVAYIMSLK